MKSQCFLSMRNWAEGEITLIINWRRSLRCPVTQIQPGWSRSPNLSSLMLALGLSRSEPFEVALLSLPLPFFLPPPPPAPHLSLSSAGAASPLPLHRAPSSLLPSRNAICSEINSKSNSDCFGERRRRKKHHCLISETPCVWGGGLGPIQPHMADARWASHKSFPRLRVRLHSEPSSPRDLDSAHAGFHWLNSCPCCS